MVQICCFKTSSEEAQKEIACDPKRIGGFAALVTGVVLVLLSTLCASGVIAGSATHFVAAGLGIGSMVAFAIAAALLIKPGLKAESDKTE